MKLTPEQLKTLRGGKQIVNLRLVMPGDPVSITVTKEMAQAFVDNMVAAHSEGQGAKADPEIRWCMVLMKHFPNPFEGLEYIPAVLEAMKRLKKS